MAITRSVRAPIVAIILIQTAALFARSFLQLRLQERGMAADIAKDLSYLLVTVMLGSMLFPVLRENKAFLTGLLPRNLLTLRLAAGAIAIGFLMRIAWWCQLVARISFGIALNPDATALAGPSFSFGCPSLPVIALGVVVMAMMAPIIEEVLHRGLIQSSLHHHRPVAAIAASAFLFTVFHPPATYLFVFAWGVVLGVQFWKTRILWPSLISHATYNGLLQLDWRCMIGTWNPPSSDLPLLEVGILASSGLALSLGMIAWLLILNNIGVREAPRH